MICALYWKYSEVFTQCYCIVSENFQYNVQIVKTTFGLITCMYLHIFEWIKICFHMVMLFLQFILFPNFHDNQHDRMLQDSSSSVLDKNKHDFSPLSLLKCRETCKEKLQRYILLMIVVCLLHFYCAFVSFLNLKASDLIYCNCIKEQRILSQFVFHDIKRHTSKKWNE